MKIDYTYTNIIDDIISYGYDYQDPNREGTYRREIELAVIKHLREDGYPIVTARKTYFKGAVGELLLFLKGSTDIRHYWNYGIRFWDDDFARYHGYDHHVVQWMHKWNTEKKYPLLETGYDMGKIYAHQYKRQHSVFDKFKANPLRTDLIVNSWQIEDLEDMCLIPCHYSFQIVGSTDGFMITWDQRSTDIILGTPINVQFYYLMGLLLEKWSGYKFNGVVGVLKKVHLYDNGMELAQKIIDLPKEQYHEGVEVELNIDNSFKDLSFTEFINEIQPSSFKISNYQYAIDEKIKMLTYN